MRWLAPCVLLAAGAIARGDTPPFQGPMLVVDAGGHTASVRRVLFTPDGTQLISVSSDKSIRIWDAATGQPLRVLRPPAGPGHEGELFAAAISQDGRRLAVAGKGVGEGIGWIYILSMPPGHIERVLKGHEGAITSLEFGPGNRLASSSGDTTARVWDAATGECTHILGRPSTPTKSVVSDHDGDPGRHTAQVETVAFDREGGRLVTASFDKTARIWTLDRREPGGRVLDIGRDRLLCAAWSPDGHWIATGSVDRSVRLWTDRGEPVGGAVALDNEVTSLRFSPDSEALLCTWGGGSRSDRNGAALLSLASRSMRASFNGHDSRVFSGALSQNGRLAASCGGRNNEIYIWRTFDGQMRRCLAGKGGPIDAVGWSPDSRTIVWRQRRGGGSPGGRGPLESSFRLNTLTAGPRPVQPNDMRALHDGGSLTIRPRAGSRSLGVYQAGASVGEIRPDLLDGDFIETYTFTRGERVAVGTNYGFLHLFDATTARSSRSFEAHLDRVSAMAPSPDGRYLLTASNDRTLRIWSLDRDRLLLCLFFADDDWIASTPEGYYAASPAGERLMGWQISNGRERVATIVPAAQLYKALYNPDAIKLLLTAGSVARALETLDGRAEAVENVRDCLPPEVQITHLAPRSDPRGRPELEVAARTQKRADHPVTALRLMIDGRPYEGAKWRKFIPVDRTAGGGEVYESWRVPLEPGRHRVSVVAECDVSNGHSEEAAVSLQADRAPPPRLFGVSVGISRYRDPSLASLKDATADALSLQTVLREKPARVFASVDVRTLLDKGATRSALFEELKWLKGSMGTRDVGVIFFAGLTVRAEDGVFYLLPSDAERQQLDATGIPGELFKQKIAGIKGKLLLMLDAWSPGADDFIRSMNREDARVIVMSASKPQGSTPEPAGLSNFTRILTNGLNGEADANKDGEVDLDEVGKYLSIGLTPTPQDPVVAVPADVRRFTLTRTRP